MSNSWQNTEKPVLIISTNLDIRDLSSANLALPFHEPIVNLPVVTEALLQTEELFAAVWADKASVQAISVELQMSFKLALL